MLHGCFRRCRHGARYRIGPGFLLACKSASFTIIGEFASGRPEIFELCPTVFYSLLLPFAFLCRPTSYIQRYMYHFCSLGLAFGSFSHVHCCHVYSLFCVCYWCLAAAPLQCDVYLLWKSFSYMACWHRIPDAWQFYHVHLSATVTGDIALLVRFETSVKFVFCLAFPCCLVVATSHLHVFSFRRIHAALLT